MKTERRTLVSFNCPVKYSGKFSPRAALSSEMEDLVYFQRGGGQNLWAAEEDKKKFSSGGFAAI